MSPTPPIPGGQCFHPWRLGASPRPLSLPPSLFHLLIIYLSPFQHLYLLLLFSSTFLNTLISLLSLILFLFYHNPSFPPLHSLIFPTPPLTPFIIYLPPPPPSHLPFLPPPPPLLPISSFIKKTPLSFLIISLLPTPLTSPINLLHSISFPSQIPSLNPPTQITF